MIKLLAFDLDGTLTQYKTKITVKHRRTLSRLAEKYRIVIVGAGDCQRIYNQLDGFPADIIGNYGMQYSVCDEGGFRLLRSECLPLPDRQETEERVAKIRERHGFSEYAGRGIEYCPSGCITIALLGTEAPLSDKLAFDPDGKKRRSFYREVAEAFPDYNVYIGGSTSFDLAPKPYNKYRALSDYCRERGIRHSETVFFGDGWEEGGNDECIYNSDIPFVKVYSYRDIEDATAPFMTPIED